MVLSTWWLQSVFRKMHPEPLWLWQSVCGLLDSSAILSDKGRMLQFVLCPFVQCNFVAFLWRLKCLRHSVSIFSTASFKGKLQVHSVAVVSLLLFFKSWLYVMFHVPRTLCKHILNGSFEGKLQARMPFKRWRTSYMSCRFWLQTNLLWNCRIALPCKVAEILQSA